MGFWDKPFAKKNKSDKEKDKKNSKEKKDKATNKLYKVVSVGDEIQKNNIDKIMSKNPKMAFATAAKKAEEMTREEICKKGVELTKDFYSRPINKPITQRDSRGNYRQTMHIPYNTDEDIWSHVQALGNLTKMEDLSALILRPRNAPQQALVNFWDSMVNTANNETLKAALMIMILHNQLSAIHQQVIDIIGIRTISEDGSYTINSLFPITNLISRRLTEQERKLVEAIQEDAYFVLFNIKEIIKEYKPEVGEKIIPYETANALFTFKTRSPYTVLLPTYMAIGHYSFAQEPQSMNTSHTDRQVQDIITMSEFEKRIPIQSREYKWFEEMFDILQKSPNGQLSLDNTTDREEIYNNKNSTPLADYFKNQVKRLYPKIPETQQQTYYNVTNTSNAAKPSGLFSNPRTPIDEQTNFRPSQTSSPYNYENPPPYASNPSLGNIENADLSKRVTVNLTENPNHFDIPSYITTPTQTTPPRPENTLIARPTPEKTNNQIAQGTSNPLQQLEPTPGINGESKTTKYLLEEIEKQKRLAEAYKQEGAQLNKYLERLAKDKIDETAEKNKLAQQILNKEIPKLMQQENPNQTQTPEQVDDPNQTTNTQNMNNTVTKANETLTEEERTEKERETLEKEDRIKTLMKWEEIYDKSEKERELSKLTQTQFLKTLREECGYAKLDYKKRPKREEVKAELEKLHKITNIGEQHKMFKQIGQKEQNKLKLLTNRLKALNKFKVGEDPRSFLRNIDDILMDYNQIEKLSDEDRYKMIFEKLDPDCASRVYDNAMVIRGNPRQLKQYIEDTLGSQKSDVQEIANIDKIEFKPGNYRQCLDQIERSLANSLQNAGEDFGDKTSYEAYQNSCLMTAINRLFQSNKHVYGLMIGNGTIDDAKKERNYPLLKTKLQEFDKHTLDMNDETSDEALNYKIVNAKYQEKTENRNKNTKINESNMYKPLSNEYNPPPNIELQPLTQYTQQSAVRKENTKEKDNKEELNQIQQQDNNKGMETAIHKLTSFLQQTTNQNIPRPMQPKQRFTNNNTNRGNFPQQTNTQVNTRRQQYCYVCGETGHTLSFCHNYIPKPRVTPVGICPNTVTQTAKCRFCPDIIGQHYSNYCPVMEYMPLSPDSPKPQPSRNIQNQNQNQQQEQQMIPRQQYQNNQQFRPQQQFNRNNQNYQRPRNSQYTDRRVSQNYYQQQQMLPNSPEQNYQNNQAQQRNSTPQQQQEPSNNQDQQQNQTNQQQNQQNQM